jgi:enoyl-CoA hydratase/carnithine racemase
MTDQEILGEKQEDIFTITLNRPGKRNAMPFEWLPRICEMVEAQVTDTDIRCMVIQGAGHMFSAGVDFNSLGSLAGRFMADHAAGGASIRADINKYQQYFNRLETIEIPIICAMHKCVFGMALELALACDIRLMSDDCRWSMPELRFGLVPDLGGTARLSRVIGASRAMEALMTGREYDARRAVDWGLVNDIFPEENLAAETRKLAADISRMAPLAVGSVKRIITRGLGQDLMTQLDMEANLQSILLRSGDFLEGINALMEQRDPKWQRK